MARVVQKFGGSSLRDLSYIRRAAQIVARRWHSGDDVLVVVSAMGDRTDLLSSLALTAYKHSDDENAESDVLLSIGEQESASLMALCLQSLGLNARSFMGWQIPIETIGVHGKARVKRIGTSMLVDTLDHRGIAVCAGFQGLMVRGDRISTLGRGGSDTSAVLLAASIDAQLCEIFTDVEGVYTSDPRLVASARKLSSINYEEMLEIASLGGRVLETRAAAAAMRYKIPLHIRSTFSSNEGTEVGEGIMEERAVTALTHSESDAKIAVLGLENQPGIASKIFGQLASKGISVDMIVQGMTQDEGKAHIAFTVLKTDISRACAALESIRESTPYQELRCDDNVIKLSLIGAGMNSSAGVAARMFTTLAEKGINIQIIATSEIKISVLISSDYLELALRSLHGVFDLSNAVEDLKQ